MQSQYGSYSTELGCFQSIETITARHMKSTSNSSDIAFALINMMLIPFDRLERMRHITIIDKLGTFGEDGYAVFLREEFKPDTIILTAIVVSIIPTAILLTSINQGFHDLGFNYVIFTFDLLACLFFSFDLLARLFFSFERGLDGLVAWLYSGTLFLPAPSSSSKWVFTLILRMLAPDWTHPRIALAWKEIRFSFLHWNKGAKQAHHSGREQVDLDQ